MKEKPKRNLTFIIDLRHENAVTAENVLKEFLTQWLGVYNYEISGIVENGEFIK
jgi:hypothetical protein